MLLHENLQAEHGDTGVRGWPLSPGHPQHCPGWGWALRQPQDRPGGQSIPLEPALTMGQALPVTPVQHWECWRWGREAVLCSRQSSRAPGWSFPGILSPRIQPAPGKWESSNNPGSALWEGNQTLLPGLLGEQEKLLPLEQLCFLQRNPKIQPEDFPAWRSCNMRDFSSRLFSRGVV